MAYTGAGLSVAAGIGMAARGSARGSSKGLDAKPTKAHYVMAELNRQDLLHGWVQQNHDGLPQKAGYRQEDINEIHGAWYDPSNPVVITDGGCLRDDLYEDFIKQKQSSDLVIVVGTTLAGHNADSCVKEISERSEMPPKASRNAKGKKYKGEGNVNLTHCSLGSVIINPQRTKDDGRATLRIFAKADDVMKALAKELELRPRVTVEGLGVFPKEKMRIKVPYDKDGAFSKEVKTYWDLSKGSKVRISSYNNLEGAKQSCDENITCETVGTVSVVDTSTCSIYIAFPGAGANQRRIMCLGLWWLATAQRGGTRYLPIVNVDPVQVHDSDLD
jgi:NAD-dependent SIR2 family protein deacetylase